MNIKEVEFLPDEFTNFHVYPKILENRNKDISKKGILKFDYIDNIKQTLIIYQKKPTQNTEILTFLTKILKAVQYNIETDVVLLGIEANFNVPFAQLKSNFSVKKILSFGVSKQQLSIHGKIKPYKPVTLGNYKILLADSLDTLMKDNGKKKQLWRCLQEIFL